MENSIELSENQKQILNLLKVAVLPLPVKPQTAYRLQAMGLVVFKGKQVPKYRYASPMILCEISAKGLEALGG